MKYDCCVVIKQCLSWITDTTQLAKNGYTISSVYTSSFLCTNKKCGRRVRPTRYAPPASNYTGTASGQDGSDWSRDRATLTFDLWGHGVCGWCESSSSIGIPSFKFVRYGARCVLTLMGLVTFIFDTLTLKLVCELHQRWGTSLPNVGTLNLWILELFAMYATDGRTDGRQNQRLMMKFIRLPGA